MNNGSKVPPTADALRVAIDRGQGSDKVKYPDPAAAPLGTDDEAAGFPPTAEQLEIASRAEFRAPPAPPQKGKSRLPWIVVVVLVAGLCVAWALLNNQ